MCKKPWFGGPFQKQHGKHAQGLLKSASEHLEHIHWPFPSLVSLKKSLLLTWKILGVLVNTLAVNEKYPVLNNQNLAIPDAIISETKNIFSFSCYIFEI